MARFNPTISFPVTLSEAQLNALITRAQQFALASPARSMVSYFERELIGNILALINTNPICTVADAWEVVSSRADRSVDYTNAQDEFMEACERVLKLVK